MKLILNLPAKINLQIYNDKIVLNDDEINKELKSIVKNNEKVMEYKLSEIEVLQLRIVIKIKNKRNSKSNK